MLGVVTYRDFTDVANSVVNLALSLPSEESRRECLGVLVRMRDALSMSAATGLQPSVPLMGFMASAEEFLILLKQFRYNRYIPTVTVQQYY